MLIREFFEDSDGRGSSARLVFICGTFIILSMALCQFLGLGTLAVAIYGILATLVSGGYMVNKYVTQDVETSLLTDASRENMDNSN